VFRRIAERLRRPKLGKQDRVADAAALAAIDRVAVDDPPFSLQLGFDVGLPVAELAGDVDHSHAVGIVAIGGADKFGRIVERHGVLHTNDRGSARKCACDSATQGFRWSA